MDELLHLKTISKPGFQALVQLTTGTDCQSRVELKVKTNTFISRHPNLDVTKAYTHAWLQFHMNNILFY